MRISGFFISIAAIAMVGSAVSAESRPSPACDRACLYGVLDQYLAALRAQGFTDEDIWDIGAITALFGLSNRMANLISLRPNDEFYLLGRVPKIKSA